MVGAGDRIKLLDFGIARILDPGSAAGTPGLTRQGDFVGTPAYAAPEQVRGLAVDGRADLYAAGILLFEALAGRRPFESPSPRGCLAQHLLEPPPRLADLAPDLPRVADLDAVIARALAKDPGLRFQTAHDLRRALLEAIGPFTPVTAGAVASPVGVATPAATADRAVLERAITDPCPGSRPRSGPGRGRLLVEGVRGLAKVFLVAGDRLAYGRSAEDPRRRVRNHVVLRVLPCRGPELDPEAWAATVRISNAHGEVVVEDGTRVSVTDRSARGTLLDGAPIPHDRRTPAPDEFTLDVAAHAIVLAGRVLRASALPQTLDADTVLAEEVDGGARPVDAVVIRRPPSCCPEHVYALVARAVSLGRALENALPLEAHGVAPRHARITHDGGGVFRIEPAGSPPAPVLLNGAGVPPGTPVPLRPGARVGLGEARLVYREASDADFTTP